MNLLVSLVEGAKTGTDDAKAITEAKKTEGSFMVRHIEKCTPKGGTVDIVYPENPKWSEVRQEKRED